MIGWQWHQLDHTQIQDRQTDRPTDQWCSKALRGPGSTVTWGALSCFGPKGGSWKLKVVRAGVVLWGRPIPGLESSVSSPSGVIPQPLTVWCFCVVRWPLLLLKILCVLCKRVISHFCHACKSESSVADHPWSLEYFYQISNLLQRLSNSWDM